METLGTTIGGFPQQESYLDPKGKPKVYSTNLIDSLIH